MDCTQANEFIDACVFLLQEVEKLYWVYPTLWGIVMVRKIFYA